MFDTGHKAQGFATDEVELYGYAHIYWRDYGLMWASTMLYVKPKWTTQPPWVTGRFQKNA